MGRLLKILLLVVAGLVGLLVIAAIGLLLFFDPNDYRDEIAAQVEKATGRELTIEGDLSLSVFPWLAVEVGRTRLANAPGFGEQPFATFERAELSVRLLPLILRRELAVGTAALDSLVLNLAVAENGETNWEDLAAEEDEPAAETAETGAADLDIRSVEVSDARINYRDAQAGAAYAVSGLSLTTGRIAGGEPFEFDTEFDFTADPGELGGHLAIGGTATVGEEFTRFAVENLEVAGQVTGIAGQPAELALNAPAIAVDTAAETVTAGAVEIGFLGVQASADVAPFSYAGTPQPKAKLRVEPFSLKRVLQALGTEPPVTADPAALTQVAFSADAAVGEEAIALTSLALELDDTQMTGRLSWPTTGQGLIRFELNADAIDVDRYMAPGGTPAAGDAPESNTDEIEIPVELIRSLQAAGSAKLKRATLAGMVFENIELGLNNVDGKLRLHPLRAELFDGTYNGDVRIDASREIPSISVDEKVEGVSLTPLARAMFEQENISGTIAGSFQLSGRGANLGEIKSDLDGKMAFQLADGAWEGTDIWYQLRTARALFRKQPPPERQNPPRTKFSSVVATGTVTDGLFRNDDLLAELPFLRLTGEGNVDLVEGTVDYRLQARVLERPEFVNPASEAELKDFTEAVIPVRVTGSLTSPSIRPDIEAMAKSRVEEAVKEKRDELKDRVLNELFGGEEDEEEDPPPDEEKELENRLKRLLDQL